MKSHEDLDIKRCNSYLPKIDEASSVNFLNPTLIFGS